MTNLDYLRRQLSLWGRICRAVGIGYPTMAATERARVGRGGSFDGPKLPEDIAEIDSFVSRCPPQHKLILVEFYTKDGDYRDHAARLRISVDALYRRRKRAEVYLNTLLNSANESVPLRAS
jgi:DNA-directed RNA polymerase specialized sigma24 family protein